MTMADRELGEELKADGWIVVGGEWMFWGHTPSRQCVDLDEYRRDRVDSPAFPEEPADPQTVGYLVSCRVHDEQGNPTGEGWGVWIESYSLALKTAREVRARVLSEAPTFDASKQMTFDDVLCRKAEA
jgi:hypothetical protein